MNLFVLAERVTEATMYWDRGFMKSVPCAVAHGCGSIIEVGQIITLLIQHIINGLLHTSFIP